MGLLAESGEYVMDATFEGTIQRERTSDTQVKITDSKHTTLCSKKGAASETAPDSPVCSIISSDFLQFQKSFTHLQLEQTSNQPQ